MPMEVPSVWASLGSHASLVARTAEMLDAMSVLVATELVVAVRALCIAGRTPAGAGVRALFDAAALVLRHRGPGVRPGRRGRADCGPKFRRRESSRLI
jgi:hypothetical protein